MTGTAGVGPPTLEIRTSAGPVRYYEVGQGPALVFVHGLLVNGALWRKVVPLLSDRFRCIVPDWPLGSHHVPMSSAADLSPPGLARTVAEVLGSLDLESATLVGNDTGGAVCQLAAAPHPERIGAMVLSDCDTYENFLPRLFRPLQVAGRVPGGVLVLAQGMRLRAMWRLPIAFGRLIKHDIDADVVDSYFEPCRSNPDVRRDTAKVLRGRGGRAAPLLRPPRPPRLGIRGPRLSRWRRRAPSGRSAPGSPRADRGLLHVHARGPARAARRARRGLRVQALTPTERDA